MTKLMEDRVLSAIKNDVADSEATIAYLEMCKHITSAYLEADLKPIERIYKIWYALYFIRSWRKWLVMQKGYSLGENFISNNAYTCVEINAHAMIEIIVKLRTIEQTNLFIPYLFASQPCEHIFRTMRSMGTINFTKINFTLNELFHLIARFEMINKITYSNKNIKFARHHSENINENTSQAALPAEFPTDREILEVMINARAKALEKASEFGISLNVIDITNTELQFSRKNQAVSTIENMLELFDDSLDDTDEEITNSTPSTSDSQSNSESFIDVIDSDGLTKRVRKTTFLWMLSESNDKLSTDRLKRVHGSSSQDSSSACKKFKSIDYFTDGSNIVKLDYIKIGDWALFNSEHEPISISFDNKNGHLIGNIIGFRYLDEKNRPKQFKTGHVSTIINTAIDQNAQVDEKNKTEVLAIWYTCHENNIVKQYNGKLTVLKQHYFGTVRPPIVKTDSSDTNHRAIYVLKFEYSDLDEFLSGSVSGL